MTLLYTIRKSFSPSSTRMLIKYHQLPEHIRMMLTAILGAGIGWVTYEIIYWFIPAFPYRATLSWSLAFMIGVMRQHALHRTLTFIDYTPYLSSLGRAYLFYAITTLCGVFLNYSLTVRFGIHHRLAWLACLLLTGLLSFFFLKRLVFKGGELT